jgi:hypothetical protein
MRLKLGLVPASVRLDPSTTENSDIGSGQNQLVFLTIGPGINYFDDPWMQKRKNVPCPRMIFHDAVKNLSMLQVFPTFSIAPKASGEGRLREINSFQAGQDNGGAQELIRWLPARNREDYFVRLENMLCQYGLTNDCEDLRPGFVWNSSFFAGNIVNNELRLWQSLPVRDFLTAVIVPAGSYQDYVADYCAGLSGSVPHWEFNCGVHFRNLFVEAPESSDRGFRSAWLMLILQRSHPLLWQLLNRARKQKHPAAFLLIADMIAKIARKNGRNFFITTFFLHFRQLGRRTDAIWLDYLEAYRNGRFEEAGRLLQEYRKSYTCLEAICGGR